MTSNSKEIIEETIDKLVHKSLSNWYRNMHFKEEDLENLVLGFVKNSENAFVIDIIRVAIKQALSFQSKQHNEAIQKTQRELKELTISFGTCNLEQEGIDKIFKQNFNLDENKEVKDEKTNNISK